MSELTEEATCGGGYKGADCRWPSCAMCGQKHLAEIARLRAALREAAAFLEKTKDASIAISFYEVDQAIAAARAAATGSIARQAGE